MRVKVSDEMRETRAIIKVIGVGGAGGNAINRMSEAGIQGVELIAANSDAQDLRRSLAEVKIQIGERLTKGLGVGGDAELGKSAAMESEDQFREVLEGADLVFITAGMGGGTGTGGAPIIARIAKQEKGALTIGVVSRPFDFEKLNRANIADRGIQELRQYVDTLLILPNQNLFDVIEATTTSDEAYKLADDVLRRSVQSISDVITIPGQINMDMNDLKAVMKDAGEALIGMGEADGQGRAQKAAKSAVASPLLENVLIDGAKGLIVNIAARKNTLTLSETEDVMAIITGTASPDAKIKMGQVYDQTMGDLIRVTVIATGFPQRSRRGQRLGVRGVAAPTRRTWESPLEPVGQRPSLAAPEDWTKPAYMRLKVRRLKT
jgi:cell division protein FtsZ